MAVLIVEGATSTDKRTNMPYTRIWVHLVWATKNRDPILTHPVRNTIFNHIFSNAQSKQIFLDTIDGQDDHVHALIALRGDQCVAKIAQLLKGESSHWVNDQNLMPGHFEWQEDYAAFSVSETDLDRVRRYIQNQEEHHRHRSFADEYQEILAENGFIGRVG